MSSKISSSTPSPTPMTTQDTRTTASANTPPMSKAQASEPAAASAFFTKDEVVQTQRDDHASFFAKETAVQTPRQKADPGKTLSIRELAMQQTGASSRDSMPAEGKAQLDALTEKLSNAGLFDAQTMSSSRELGTQLNTSFFDDRSNQEAHFLGIRDMFDHEAQTRTAIDKSLCHIPDASKRKEAVDAVMDKLANKLCDRVQADMQREVMFCTEVAKKELEPFCGTDSTQRIALMQGLATSELSCAQMQDRLQKVGIAPDDAESLAEDLLAVRHDPGAREALLGGDLSKPEWQEGIVMDGDLRNLDQAMQSAFVTAREGIDIVQEQLSNDRSSGDATFSNPLFEQAYQHACERHGIDPGEGAREMLDARVEGRKTHDKIEGFVCTGILTIAALAVPGGVAVALGTGAASSAPGVLVAQQNATASKGGLAAGTNDAKLVETQVRARDIEAGAAVLGAVLGVAGNVSKGAVGTSALDDVASKIDVGDAAYVMKNAEPGHLRAAAEMGENVWNGSAAAVETLAEPVAQSAIQTAGTEYLKQSGD